MIGGQTALRVMQQRSILGLAGLLATALFLAGCGGGPDIRQGAAEGCPPLAVLGDAERLVKFRPGPGRQRSDVLYDADFVRTALECKRRQFVVDLDVELDITASAGLSATRSGYAIPYFVAVTRGQDVLTKKVFWAEAVFKDSDRTVLLKEKVDDLRVPLPEGIPVEEIDVFVGFELNRAEVDYNRSRR